MGAANGVVNRKITNIKTLITNQTGLEYRRILFILKTKNHNLGRYYWRIKIHSPCALRRS